MTLILLETQLLVVIFMFALAVLGKLHAPKDRLKVLAILVECALCVLLLVSAHLLVRLATAMLLISATWVLDELRVLRPGQGCGCFGVLSTVPVTAMTVLRTGLLGLAAAAAVPVQRAGLEVLLDLPGWRSMVFLAEVGLIAALSPEISTAVRRRPVPCERRAVPLRETFAVLHASEPWRRYGLARRSEPAEVWREACWRFLVYPLEDGGEVVFAVSLADGQVRAATADEELTAPVAEQDDLQPSNALLTRH
ncbi:hypothetical protein [Actinocorallia populi]|uniref:hypothetical protein n=1 Tax=Actinocorallia populi TaxID=2079200 RepID=UPI000D08AEDA|nr:hypothetical protein [Actinocorallia populi]